MTDFQKLENMHVLQLFPKKIFSNVSKEILLIWQKFHVNLTMHTEIVRKMWQRGSFKLS